MYAKAGGRSLRSNTHLTRFLFFSSMNFLVKVWDLPTRIFHWALVVVMSASVFTVLVLEHMVWHARFGYVLVTLLCFRLVWGVIGGHWSRFAHFWPSVSDSMAYLRRPGSWTRAGHNPLGSWSVFVMLVLIGLQLITGMASDDDAGFTGPLTPHISGRWVSMATAYHSSVGKWLLLAMVIIHIAAILYHALYQKMPLVRAMVSGYQLLDHENPASADSARHRWLAVLIFLVCAALSYGALTLLDSF